MTDPAQVKPADVSGFYADLGAEYSWASPTYIRDNLTEVQLHGYTQHVPRIRQARWKSLALMLVAEAERMLLRVGFLKRK